MTNIYNDYLQHHGVKGQRWGIRRYQNPDGTLIKKGSELYRFSKYPTDEPPAGRIARDNGYSLAEINRKRMYVSTNKDDDRKWDSNFATRSTTNGMPVFHHVYTAKKDIVVMPSEKSREIYKALLENPRYAKRTLKDYNENGLAAVGRNIETALNKDPKNIKRIQKLNNMTAKQVRYSMENSKDYASRANMEVNALSKTGKRIIKEAKKQGYGAMFDQLGTDVAKSPTIIFDTDRTMKRIKKKSALSEGTKSVALDYSGLPEKLRDRAVVTWNSELGRPRILDGGPGGGNLKYYVKYKRN